MNKYKKKPLVIEAMLLTPESLETIALWVFGIEPRPLINAVCVMIIPTLEGNHQAQFGDYIIKGIKGEFYPCKPDIFKATYDLIVEE